VAQIFCRTEHARCAAHVAQYTPLPLPRQTFAASTLN